MIKCKHCGMKIVRTAIGWRHWEGPGRPRFILCGNANPSRGFGSKEATPSEVSIVNEILKHYDTISQS